MGDKIKYKSVVDRWIEDGEGFEIITPEKDNRTENKETEDTEKSKQKK